MWPHLIIFDFDGVLADSEALACGIAAAYATDLGAPMSAHEGLVQFMGRRSDDVRASVEKRIGRDVPDFIETLQARTLAAFETSLEPVAGAADFLQRTDGIARCIASSSSHARLTASLARIGLGWDFEGTVFSADDVERGKPFPDLFLHAARTMGVAPSDTLVIEDSPGGVKAALAAGMPVVGLLAGSHVLPDHRSRLEAAGAARVFDSFAAVAAWLDDNVAGLEIGAHPSPV